MPATAKPRLYNPRHPERSLLHQTVAERYLARMAVLTANTPIDASDISLLFPRLRGMPARRTPLRSRMRHAMKTAPELRNRSATP